MEKKVYEIVCDTIKEYVICGYTRDFDKTKKEFYTAIFGLSERKKEKYINKEIKLRKDYHTKKYKYENVDEYFSDSVFDANKFFKVEFSYSSEYLDPGILELDLTADTIYKLNTFIEEDDDIQNYYLGRLFNYLCEKIKYLKMIEFLILERANLQTEKGSTKKEKAITNQKNQSTSNNNSIKEHDYIKIGVLIAQGKIIYVSWHNFKYKDKEFDKKQLEKELQADLNIKTVRQYIDSTFLGNDKAITKNDLKRHPTKRKKIIQYCNHYKISINNEY